jgi:hypothetical protein
VWSSHDDPIDGRHGQHRFISMRFTTEIRERNEQALL